VCNVCVCCTWCLKLNYLVFTFIGSLQSKTYILTFRDVEDTAEFEYFCSVLVSASPKRDKRWKRGTRREKGRNGRKIHSICGCICPSHTYFSSGRRQDGNEFFFFTSGRNKPSLALVPGWPNNSPEARKSGHKNARAKTDMSDEARARVFTGPSPSVGAPEKQPLYRSKFPGMQTQRG
jgi:hypothetical protein